MKNWFNLKKLKPNSSLHYFELYGVIDPKLCVYLKTTYKSKTSSKHSGVQDMTPIIKYDIQQVLVDKKGHYQARISLEPIGNHQTELEYNNTAFIIRRDPSDIWHSHMVIASHHPKTLSIGRSSDHEQSHYLERSTTKKHYLLSSGNHIECYTRWYEHLNTETFTSEFIDTHSLNGVNTLNEQKTHIDIHINEDKCVYIPSKESNKPVRPDYFREHTPSLQSEKKTILTQCINFFKKE